MLWPLELIMVLSSPSLRNLDFTDTFTNFYSRAHVGTNFKLLQSRFLAPINHSNMYHRVNILILESKIEQKRFNFDFWCRRSTIISWSSTRILSRNRSSFISIWCTGGETIGWITEMDRRIYWRRWQYGAGSCYNRLVFLYHVGLFRNSNNVSYSGK